MSMWIGATCSNYFRVRDEAAFEAVLDLYDGVEMITDEEGRVGFAIEDELPDSDDGEGLWSQIALHLDEGEIAIYKCAGTVGSEAVNGFAVAIGWDGQEMEISLDDIYAQATKNWPDAGAITRV